jgi:hypothetical protein
VIEYYSQLAVAYHKLLTRLDWEDEVLISGIREGLNKFLSNAHLHVFRGKNKYHKTHLVSEQALAQMEARDYSGLVFEHMVPKDRFQKDCEERAKSGTLTIEFVEDQLKQFWHLATITKEEEARLTRNSMPDNWDGKDPRARYMHACITLKDNPFFQKTKRGRS